MTIQQLEVTHAVVQQSSPFPCDNNTITVAFRTNLPVLAACAPRLTMMGFGSAALPAVPGNISITSSGGAAAVGVNVGFGTYGWWTGSGAGAGNGGCGC